MSRESSSELLGTITDTADPMVAVAGVLIDRAGEADPAFADLVMAAAVPRKFDDALLAHLTSTRQDDPEFRRVFDALLSMPFVSRRRDGRLRLHNEIRTALLTRAESADDGHWLRGANERVAAYYDNEHENARQLADQLGLVDDVLRIATPERVPTIRAACQDRLVRAVLEAQHHRTVIDPAGSGFDAFQRTFQRYEAENRLGVLRMLLTSFGTDVERMASVPGRDTAGVAPWLEYYGARLQFAEGANSAALDTSRGLLARDDLDVRLRTWTLALVTNTLTTRGQLAEALQAVAEEKAARPDPDPDPWNLPLVYVREAGIHAMLWDPDRQEASLRAALDAVRATDDSETETSTLQQLAEVLARRGDIAGAAEHAVRAIHVTRTRQPPSTDAAWSNALQMMSTFGGRDPRLADLFSAEARALVRGEPVRTIASATSFANVLNVSGQYARAHAVLGGLAGIVGDVRPDQRSAVEISYANLLDAEGREREAVERNQRTVREVRAQYENPWAEAVALTNAATTEMLLGDLLDQAAASAAAGRDLWSRMGHARGMTITQAVQAEVARRRGRYAEAETLLTAHPPPDGSRPVLVWNMVSADLAIDLGRLDEAIDHLRTIVDEQLRMGDVVSAASAASWAIRVNLRAGRLKEAQRYTAIVNETMGELAGVWAYTYEPALDTADQHNARAVRQLSAEARRPTDALRDAVQNLEEAIRLDGTTCWFWLNQAYARVRLGDRKTGQKAFDRARDLAPAPYRAAIAAIADDFRTWTPELTA